MASFIYFYSKFTEELLLLTAAGAFTLLSLYCYTWVVKKRRLGAARDQVPAGMVKIYLNQLINEAQFVRTQLFGLVGGVAPTGENFAAHFQAHSPQTSHVSTNNNPSSNAEIPNDLLARLKALEGQLSDKESMVVNINVEKTKLLEEVENLRQNAKAMGSASTGNNDDLIKKIKALEERLEEYALFEEDLANLKRLQQENAQLKKQLEQAGTARPEPTVAPTAVESPKDSLLDQSAIDALLDGSSAIAPTPSLAAEPPKAEPLVAAVAPPIDLVAKTAVPEQPAPLKKADEFEKLVDSVETSLSAQAPAPEAAMEAPVQAAASLADKTDEELLKEFENLLNS